MGSDRKRMSGSRRRALPFGLVVIAAVVAAGVVLVKGPGGAAAQDATSVAGTGMAGVTITSGGCTGGGSAYCYTPEALSIPTGTTVVWTNESGVQHTATKCTATACAGAPASTGTQTFAIVIAAANGSTGSFTFTSAGTYIYYCSIHGYSLMHAKITVVKPPKITSFTPTSGAPGTSVTINGSRLKPASNVSFNGTTAHVVSDTSTKIVATVPTGATTGHISVTTPGGTATSSGTFTVT